MPPTRNTKWHQIQHLDAPTAAVLPTNTLPTITVRRMVTGYTIAAIAVDQEPKKANMGS